MNPLAGRRTRAYLLDCLGYAGIAAATAPLGFGLRALGWRPGAEETMAVSAIPVAIACVVAATGEARRGSTWGKRKMGLEVVSTDGGRLSRGRALARNVVKIGLPWQLGHMVTIGAIADGFENGDPVTIGATAALYPLMAALAAGGIVGSGRTVADRIAGAQVRPASTGTG